MFRKASLNMSKGCIQLSISVVSWNGSHIYLIVDSRLWVQDFKKLLVHLFRVAHRLLLDKLNIEGDPQIGQHSHELFETNNRLLDFLDLRFDVRGIGSFRDKLLLLNCLESLPHDSFCFPIEVNWRGTVPGERDLEKLVLSSLFLFAYFYFASWFCHVDDLLDIIDHFLQRLELNVLSFLVNVHVLLVLLDWGHLLRLMFSVLLLFSDVLVIVTLHLRLRNLASFNRPRTSEGVWDLLELIVVLVGIE